MTGETVLNVFAVAGTVAGGLALIGVIGKAGKWMWRMFRQLQNFLEDWAGEPARPGVDERLGFPARIAVLEGEVAGVKAIVSNGLSSNVADIQRRVSLMEQRGV